MLADSGEDAIAYCPQSDYAANVELAEAIAPTAARPVAREPMQKVPTPGKTRCEDVAALLGLPLARTVKAIAVMHDEAFNLLLVRGDLLFNEGDMPDALYVVLRGRIAVANRSPDGRESVLALMEPGELICAMGMLDEDATASSACEINTVLEYDQVLAYPSTAGALLTALDFENLELDDLRTHRPTLEDVFVALTGKHLRDG